MNVGQKYGNWNVTQTYGTWSILDVDNVPLVNGAVWTPWVDLAWNLWDPIQAFSWGTIVSVTTGKSNVSVEDINAGRAQASYGNQVVIRDINGRLHQYNHLDSVAQFREGQAIQKGQTIGTMWNTWSSTNVHLDYRVQSERWWEDPRQFMSNTVDTKDEIATLDSFLQKRSSTPGGNITSKVKPPYVNQIIQEDIGRFELSTEEFKKLTEIPGANVDSKITTKYRLEKFAQKDTAQYSSDDMVDVLRKLFDKNEWSEASILQMAVYTWKLDDWIFENGIFNDGYGYDMLQEYFDDPDDTIKEIKKNLEANWYIVKKQESGNVYAGDGNVFQNYYRNTR